MMAAESNVDFKWLEPELPSSRKFEARATYVDGSGQIYLQLESQRDTVRILKRLLNEKLGESRMDCDKNSFNSGQECSVKWKDGNWYRGRFLGYCGLDREECCVLLVDYGNLYVTKVQNVRSAIYGERIPALPPSHPPPLPAPT